MIIMIESGRLGNQVFQYLALRSCARAGEGIQLFGFDQLDSVFTGVQAKFTSIQANPLRHLQSIDSRRLGRLAKLLPATGIISEDSTGNAVVESRGRLMLAAPSWFQNSNILAEPALALMQVRESWLARAHAILAELGLTPELTAFVHVRAGDYRTWPSAEHPAILTPDWYSRQAAQLKESVPDLQFIIIGDEPAYRAEVTRAIPTSVEIESTFETEFALMTICASGILSASTFAFWGAYFAHRERPGSLFIAPEFWAGHRCKTWYPSSLQATFLTYV